MVNLVRTLGCLALAGLFAGCEGLSDGKPAAKPDKPVAKKVNGTSGKVDTGPQGKHKVGKGPFKIEITFTGILEAEEMTEVAFRPDYKGLVGPSTLTVLKAVDHGTPIRKGDPLIRFDTARIDRAIRDLTNEHLQAELTIRLAAEELPLLEKSTPVELAVAERAMKQADEDLAKFVKVDRAEAIKAADFVVKNAANYLEYAKEELHQLEKMYRADDMREETEEIILKRQRNAVASATYSLKRAERQRDQVVKVDMPRKEQALKDALVKMTHALDKAKSTLPLTLTQKRLALAKLKYDQARSVARLHKLQKDRQAMNIKAPADGIVYHGKCQRGHWNTAAVTDKLQPSGVVAADEVIITIVNPRPLFVRALIEEKDWHQVRPGIKGKAVATANSSLKLAAKVDKISAVPVSPGHFETRVAIEVPKDAEALMPGMACTIRLMSYSQANALAVPASAVFPDEVDDDKHFVYRADKTGKPVKRPVTVGKSFGDKVEIVAGLDEGDEIWLERPAETPNSPTGNKKGNS